MVKIGRSIGGGDGNEKKLGGKKARPPSSRMSPDNQVVTELVTVALVRHGFDLQSETKRIFNVAGDKTFREFRSLVCESLGLTESYPLRFTVMGVSSPINAGTRMSTLYEEASQDSAFEGVLYIRH